MENREEDSETDDELSHKEPILPGSVLKLEIQVEKENKRREESPGKPSSSTVCSQNEGRMLGSEDTDLTTTDNLSCYDFGQLQILTPSCLECNMTYTSLLHMERHLKICKARRASKLESGGLSCDIEGLMTIIDDKKTYCCDVCDYKTTFRVRIKRHLFTHTDERPHICEICGRGFVEASFLITHQRIHSGDKLFKCSECAYTCNVASSLKRHMTSHTGERKYSCSECNFKTAERAKLEIHSRVHTGDKPYSCSLCSFKTAYNAHLINHMKIHSGDRQFSCPFCNYCAIQERHLLEHVTIHSGEKPFPCPYCQYRSKQKGTLTRHIARQHNKTTAVS